MNKKTTHQQTVTTLENGQGFHAKIIVNFDKKSDVHKKISKERNLGLLL